jgi:hypothetical protein
LTVGNPSPSTTSLTVNGNIVATGTITSGSDYRIKQNIKLINLEEHNIDDLNPSYYYNTIARYHEFGFIAHEVQEVFPFLVRGNKNDTQTQSLNYNGFIALLTREIQELKKDVKELKEQILVLENK